MAPAPYPLCTRTLCVCLASLIVLAVIGVAGCGPDPALDRGEGFDAAFLENGDKLYSQDREELIIRHFFRDRKGGVFLDVGSYHWKQLSTTLYLEDHLGWSGIALDAQHEA